MPTGHYYPGLESHAYAGLTGNLAAIQQWRTFDEDVASLPTYGALTDTQPVTEPALNRTGRSLPGFGADWYHRIHVSPGDLNLGNILSQQTRTVEVWNAYLEPNTLTSFTGVNTEGLTVIEPAPAPTEFGPLEARLYQFTIATGGPATVDAEYTYVFETDTVVLPVTGKRVVLFSFAPDWSRPLVERLEWLTDVLRAYGGAEQRIQLRIIPRRSFEMQFLLDGHKTQLFDALLYGWQARVFAVPVWTDPHQLALEEPAGATVINVDTAHRDYHADGLLILWRDYLTHEIAEIANVGASSVTLKRGLSQSWPAGTRVYPGRLGRLPASVSIKKPTAALNIAILRFDLEGNTAAAAMESGPVHQGLRVLETSPNRVTDLDEAFSRQLEVIDSLTGLRAVDDHTDYPDIVRTFSWLLHGRPAIGAYRGWLHSRAGRCKAVFVPTFHEDLTLTETVAAAATVLKVRDIGYRSYYQTKPGKRDLMIETHTGARYYRRITGANEGDTAGEERISINTSLGMQLEPGQIRRVCFMGPHRFDGDSVELAWLSTELVQVEANMRLLAE
jgi:hypothetical protein